MRGGFCQTCSLWPVHKIAGSNFGRQSEATAVEDRALGTARDNSRKVHHLKAPSHKVFGAFYLSKRYLKLQLHVSTRVLQAYRSATLDRAAF